MGKQARGFKGTLLLAYETVYGVTPATPSAYALPFVSNGLASTQGLITSTVINGRRDPTEPGRGLVDANGQIAVPVDVRNSGVWLTMMFGAPVTTNVSTSGSLTGATGVTTTIGTWTAVLDGAFKVAIDGSAATAVGPIDFSSGVTTMANVASKIQTAIRAVATGGFTNATVTWDTTNTRFVIASGTTGDSSAVSQLTAPAGGTDISVAGFMKCTAGTLATGKTLYQHVYTIGDDMPSTSIQKGFGDIGAYGVCPGCKVSKFSLSAQMGNNEFNANMDMLAADEVFNAVTMDESPTELTFTRFNVFQASVKEGGSALSVCRKFDINIDFGLDGDTYCYNDAGSSTRQDINEGLAAITGNIETLFKDQVLLNKAINGTETSLEFKFINGAYSLVIELGELIFERKSPTIDGPKGVLFSPNYQAYLNNGANNAAVKITLINDVASYAIA